MRDAELYQQLLGLSPPWTVTRVALDIAAQHQARDAGDPTPIALCAWARLRDEENADVVRRLRTRGEAPFAALARFLDNDPPGALSLPTIWTATPGLDTRTPEP